MLRPSSAMDWNSPTFHVAPSTGWINDPNGPISCKGKTHIFYQHVKDKPSWDWGIVWGHDSSEDLVHWTRMPTALTPVVRGADSAGCWSGCVTFDSSGQLHALYTGVRLKGQPYDGPQTETYAPDEPMIESIMRARCLDSSKDLKDWTPGEVLVAEPPAEFMASHGPLEGWRDPFVISTHHSAGKQGKRKQPLQMVVGSGYRVDGKKNGCVLLYCAEGPSGPWQYQGVLAAGNCDQGRVWECPALAQIPPLSSPDIFSGFKPSEPGLSRDCVVTTIEKGDTGDSAGCHMLLYGAYTGTEQHESWHWDPVMVLLGQFDGSLFHADHAASRLDIGDAPYAANVHIDSQGRVILWLWLRDRRPPSPACPPSDTCGCLAVPRVLSYVGAGDAEGEGQHGPAQRVLFQHPVPELHLLRGPKTDLASDLSAPHDKVQLLHTSDGSHFEAQLQIHRKEASLSVIILTVDAMKEENALMVVILWNTDEWMWVKGNASRLLTVPLDVESLTRGNRNTWKGPLDRQITSPLAPLSDPMNTVGLQVLVDGSAVEVFTSSGKAASTRLYGNDETKSLQLHWVGGSEGCVTGALWPMKSCWKDV